MADVGITDLFHIIHVSETLEPLDAFYDDVFGPRRGIMDGNYSAMEKRDASLVAIGNCIIEPMAPSKNVEGWDVMPVGRFWKKFGSHWHSLAWYCTETGAIWDQLVPRGVRMVTDGGNPLDGRPTGERSATSNGSLFTHPKDTGTQLEFYPHVMPSDPRFAPGWDGEWWAANHPLGLRRLAYATLVVRDMDRAVDMYVGGLGGKLLHEDTSALTGTRNVYVLIGADTIVELASPASGDSLAGQDLAAYGDMLHAVAFRVNSLPAAEQHLAGQGIGVIARDDHTIVADPQKTFGAPFRFTTWDVPGDPRN
jgi:catechol 2,3-dioxygenase-like lactoylglutathione lyase family enzyme